MKSWRTLGLKASKSLKIITTGGGCESSLAGELRFFPGVPKLDFCNNVRLGHQTLFMHQMTEVNSSTLVWLSCPTFVFALYQAQSVPREQCTALLSGAPACSASSSSSSSSSSSAPRKRFSLFLSLRMIMAMTAAYSLWGGLYAADAFVCHLRIKATH